MIWRRGVTRYLYENTGHILAPINIPESRFLLGSTSVASMWRCHLGQLARWHSARTPPASDYESAYCREGKAACLQVSTSLLNDKGFFFTPDGDHLRATHLVDYQRGKFYGTK